ncbi:hypothetical protein [Paraburkholderia sp. HD33-4]|uniref:hypothetical protein n=1 Tax=Paraburkholderia sp. HD33-4 TaxID=2883242 RepID=UPI001F209741|nr:hypothetical protein [Paraburkholderia sp. HD33-4]
MKGYLLRLAASVTRPAPALHPLVGSLFSGSKQSEQAAAGAHLEPLAAAAHEHDFAAVATTTDRPGYPSAAPARRDEDIRLRFQERGAYAPLIEHETFDSLFARGEPDLRTARGVPADTRADASVEHSPTLEPAPSQARGSRTALSETRAPDPPRIVPLVAEDVRQSARPSALDPFPAPMMAESAGRTAAPTAKLPARDGPSALRRPSTPDTGDIQIHIGRIEVMAAPPMAPRPAATPVRRTMSLDEYLKRRDGGNR